MRAQLKREHRLNFIMACFATLAVFMGAVRLHARCQEAVRFAKLAALAPLGENGAAPSSSRAR